MREMKFDHNFEILKDVKRMVRRRRSRKRRRISRHSTRRRTATKQWVKRNFGQAGRHYFSTSIPDAGPGTLYVHTFNTMSKGTNIGQRIGDMIRLRGIHCLWTFRNNLADKRLFLRCVIAQDRKPQLAAAEDFFLNDDNANNPHNWASGGTISQMNKLINKQRFKVFFDQRWSVGPNSVQDGYKNMKLIKFYVPFKNKKITFNTDANTSIQITPVIRAFYWVASHDSAATFGAGNQCEHGISWREYYEM